jgi:4-amino-4-deoxy-L-arabinose transferase-like glycosyltransferase
MTGGAQPPARSLGSQQSRTRRRSRLGAEWIALALLVAAAAALRLVDLGGVAADPYYDSAVRSMGLSLHNFFFGALEPGATVSLDKPPLDLWPAVLFSKLFGFGVATIRLPEALAGAASVALLYLALRRVFGARAAIAAAAALAVLPVEVITSRSDTTDAIMMALLTLALYLVVRAIQSGRSRWLLSAAAVLGIAFNVKLAESWLALPPLALIVWLGFPSPSRPRRSALVPLLAAVAVYVAVALSWLTVTLLVPASQQPYAIGSTNGSPWNAAFVFNGVDRLRGSQQLEGSAGSFDTHRRYPQATQAERDQIPIPPPSPTRLLARIGPLSGERLGLEALVALLLGLPALIWLWREHRREARPRETVARAGDQVSVRLRTAVLSGLALWLLEGITLFSAMARLHPRYTEAFTPAVAAMLGVGIAWVTAARTPARRALACVTVLAVVLYSEHLLYGFSTIWWVTLGTGASAVVFIALPLARDAAFLALLCCVLAIPLWASLNALSAHVSDANVLGSVPAAELERLSVYLRSHQGAAHYEVAYGSATMMGALVERDARPVLPLTTVEGRALISPARVRALASSGAVRYAFIPASCPAAGAREDSNCSRAAIWIRAHARDVSSQAGLRAGTLWELPGAHGAR